MDDPRRRERLHDLGAAMAEPEEDELDEALGHAHDLDAAIDLLTRAHASDPEALGWYDHHELGDLLMERFELRETAGEPDPAMERSRSDADDLDRAAACFRAGADLLATLLWSERRALAETLAIRATAFGGDDVHAETIALLGELRQTLPGGIGAALELALVYLLHQDADGLPRDPDAVIGLLEPLLSEPGELPPPSDDRLTESRCHALLGRLLLWRGGLDLPEVVEEPALLIAVRLGQVPETGADLDAAVRHLTRAVALDGDDAESAIMLGTLLLATGAAATPPDALMRCLDGVPPHDPRWPRADGLALLIRSVPGPEVPPGEHRLVKHLGAFAGGLGAGHPMRPAALTFWGAALCTRGARAGDEPMCVRGAAALGEALEGLDPGHPLWSRLVVEVLDALVTLRISDQIAVNLDRLAPVLAAGSEPWARAAYELAHGWRGPTRPLLGAAAGHLADAMRPPWTEDPASSRVGQVARLLFAERYAATQDLAYLDLAQRCGQDGIADVLAVQEAVVRRDPAMAAQSEESLRTLAGEGHAREAAFFGALAAAVRKDAAAVTEALAPTGGADDSGSPGPGGSETAQRAALAIMRGAWHRDEAELSRGIELLRGLVDAPLSHVGGLSARRAALGVALIKLHEIAPAPGILDEAILHLEHAADERRADPGLTMAGQIHWDLAAAHRKRNGGDGPAVDTALASLHARLREVRLQSGTEHMLAMSRAGGGQAMTTARWCVADGRTDALVEALELGRGLVLRAATSVRTVPELLRERGEHDLAARWESAPDVKPELGARVLAALGESMARRPPSAGEIAAALRSAGADALVHLLPGRGPDAGLAVLVRADGGVTLIPLPELRAGGPVQRYVSAHAAYPAALAEGQKEEARATWGRALAELSEWAGPAVMAPVLAGFGGVPRLVLVPWGPAGIVPWHAARLDGGYACQRAILTYAVSGRQLIDALGRPYRPLQDRPVIVSEPAGERVRWSRWECAEIAALCYPHATRLGTWPEGAAPPATAKELTAALTEASVLHFSGHADSSVWAADSHLVLSAPDGSGDGEHHLTVADILRLDVPPGAPGALLVLPGCLTDLAMDDYDEALTLSTAMLASVAAGVVGSRWLVDDDPRSAVMMAMFHHHLGRTPTDPARALRETQLWMLDPGRVLPDGITRRLRGALRGLDCADPRIWAAFTHQGS